MAKIKAIGLWIWVGMAAIGLFFLQALRIRNLKEEAKQAEEKIDRLEATNNLIEQQGKKQMEALQASRERRQQAEESIREGKRNHFESQ